MQRKKCRSIKVIEQSGYKYKAMPTIMLKGQWLSELGFEIGDYIKVSCENGKLIITPDEERKQMEFEENEYMKSELEKLHKRYQKEKEQIHAQFVAERKAGYGV